MTSYLSENEAENLQNDDVHLAQIPDFEIRYLENQPRSQDLLDLPPLRGYSSRQTPGRPAQIVAKMSPF